MAVGSYSPIQPKWEEHSLVRAASLEGSRSGHATKKLRMSRSRSEAARPELVLTIDREREVFDCGGSGCYSSCVPELDPRRSLRLGRLGFAVAGAGVLVDSSPSDFAEVEAVPGVPSFFAAAPFRPPGMNQPGPPPPPPNIFDRSNGAPNIFL